MAESLKAAVVAAMAFALAALVLHAVILARIPLPASQVCTLLVGPVSAFAGCAFLAWLAVERVRSNSRTSGLALGGAAGLLAALSALFIRYLAIVSLDFGMAGEQALSTAAQMVQETVEDSWAIMLVGFPLLGSVLGLAQTAGRDRRSQQARAAA